MKERTPAARPNRGAGDFAEGGDEDAPPQVFWSATRHVAVLEVDAEPCLPGSPDAFDLADLPCPAWLRQAEDGREDLLIGDGRRRLALTVHGAGLAVGPVRLRYRIAGFTTAEAGVMALRRLLALQRLRRLPAGLYPPERRARRWANALRAHDGRRAGASQREIAITLFGRNRVEDAWYDGGDDLRKTVSRLLRTGERLIDGQWRDLLRS